MKHALLATLAAVTFLTGGADARAAVDGALVGECVASEQSDGSPGSNTCPVNLTQGRDYELRHHGDWGYGKGELVNPQGVAGIVVQGAPDSSYGREFRAAYTATYQLRLSEAGLIKVSIYTDCRNSTKTQCRLPLTGRGDGVNTTNTDFDLFKTPTLRKGRTYTLTLSAQTYTKAAVVTSGGATVAQGNISEGAKTIRFRSPVDGSVYVRVGQGYLYSLTLR